MDSVFTGHLKTWTQNYNASLKLRPTLVKVTDFDSIF